MPRSGRPTKLTAEQEQSLKARLISGPRVSDVVTTFNGATINDLVAKEYQTTFSTSGIYSLLHRLEFSRITLRPKHEKNDLTAMLLWKQETLPNKYLDTCKKYPDKEIEIWFQDEMRFGEKTTISSVWALKGSAPSQFKQLGFRNSYLYGAVNPSTAERVGLVYPGCNSDVMNVHLDLISQRLGEKRHAVLVLDGAGWHESSGKILVPSNITLLSLPPYSPELNPVERLWRWIKGRYLKNRLITKEEDLEKIGCEFWNHLTDAVVKSLCKLRYKPFTNF